MGTQLRTVGHVSSLLLVELAKLGHWLTVLSSVCFRICFFQVQWKWFFLLEAPVHFAGQNLDPNRGMVGISLTAGKKRLCWFLPPANKVLMSPPVGQLAAQCLGSPRTPNWTGRMERRGCPSGDPNFTSSHWSVPCPWLTQLLWLRQQHHIES